MQGFYSNNILTGSAKLLLTVCCLDESVEFGYSMFLPPMRRHFPLQIQNKQLYQLIHEHLLLSGLKKAAEALRKEADFTPLVAEGSCPAVYPPGAMITSTTLPLPSVRRLILSPPHRCTYETLPRFFLY